MRESTFVDSGSILDLVLTTEEDRVASVANLPPLPGCHHTPILVEYVFQMGAVYVDPDERTVMWSRGDYGGMRVALADIDWHYKFLYGTVEENYSLFQSIVHSLVDRFVPTRDSASRPSWLQGLPRELMSSRSQAWAHYKRLRGELGRQHEEVLESLWIFSRLSFEYRNFSRLSQCQYEQELENNFSVAPKMVHSYIRRRKKGCPSVGPLKLPSGEVVAGQRDMSQLFVNSFSSVFVDADLASPSPHHFFPGKFGETCVTRLMVSQVLDKLDSSSAPGPDGIHPCVLKSCSWQMSLPLSLIFVKSLSHGVLPVT